MNQIEKILAEIERRTGILTRIYAEQVERKDEEMQIYYHGKIVALEELRSFVESLEKEQNTPFESAWEEYAKSKGGGAITTNVKTLSKHFYELGCRHSDNAQKIKGWVARDRDGALFLHEKYPKRIKEEMELDGEICYWGNGGVRHYIDRELFPDITWADNPVEYELTFHRV